MGTNEPMIIAKKTFVKHTEERTWEEINAVLIRDVRPSPPHPAPVTFVKIFAKAIFVETSKEPLISLKPSCL